MNSSQDRPQAVDKSDLLFSSLSLKPVTRTLWLMIGRVLEYDINIGTVMQPDLPTMDSLKFTVVAIEAYQRALSEISSGYSCAFIVQVPKSSDDELIKLLPETFFLKAGS
jgi:hypothetical protein